MPGNGGQTAFDALHQNPGFRYIETFDTIYQVHHWSQCNAVYHTVHLQYPQYIYRINSTFTVLTVQPMSSLTTTTLAKKAN